MEIGKVIGSVTSVSKIDELKPVKLFIIQLLTSDFKLRDKYEIAIDTIGAGYADIVLITIGGSSRFTEISKPTHTDASIIARVDNVNI